MKIVAAFLLVGLWANPGAQALDRSDADQLDTWEVQHSSDGGFSVQMPCTARDSSDDDYNDGYGHKFSEYELSCWKWVAEGRASFRVTRITMPTDPSYARREFQKFMALVRSPPKDTTVRLIGQQSETHADYVLKQRSIRGDLGFHVLSDGCMWNFMGLDGKSEVQAVLTLPRSLCPAGRQPVLNATALKFFDSIHLDPW